VENERYQITGAAIAMTAEEFREKWGLTQKAIAKLIDVAPSTVHHWSSIGEHDSQRKEPPHVERLLDVLDAIFSMLESNPAIVKAWEMRGVDRRKKGGNGKS